MLEQGGVQRAPVASGRGSTGADPSHSDPLCPQAVDIADVNFEEWVNDVVGERVEHWESHVREDQQGDQHRNEPWSEQVLRHEVEDDVG